MRLKKWEVVLTVFKPSYLSVRLPPVYKHTTAKRLALELTQAYPESLVEIANEGLRTCV